MTVEREPVFGGKPWSEKYTFVPALRVGDTVYLSGMTGTDENGVITAPVTSRSDASDLSQVACSLWPSVELRRHVLAPLRRLWMLASNCRRTAGI